MTALASAAIGTMTQIAALVAANLGRRVELNSQKEKQVWRIASVSDKVGALKDKTKAEYVVLMRDGVATVTSTTLHPEKALTLINKGKVDNYKLLPADPTDAAAIAAKTTDPEGSDQDDLEAEAAGDLEASNAGVEEVKGETTGTTTVDPKEDKEAIKATKKAEAEAARKAKADEAALAKADRQAVRAKKLADDKAAREAKKKAEIDTREAKKKAKGPTAKEQCLALFNAEPPDVGGVKTHRKNVIAKMKADPKDGGLGLSGNCANTYYQNMKSGQWKLPAAV